MKKPPLPSPERALEPSDAIEELSDDAIVSQRSLAHAPKPRAQVRMEAETVVVSEPPGPIVEVAPEPDGGSMPAAEPPTERQLPQYRRGAADKTITVGGRKKVVPRTPARAAPRRRWVTVALWVVAGALAFAVGGVIALMSGDRSGAAEVSPATVRFAPPTPTPRAEAALAVAAPADTLAPSQSGAMSPQALPPESRQKAAAAGRAPPQPRPAVTLRTPSPVPRPAKPAGTEIPSGI